MNIFLKQMTRIKNILCIGSYNDKLFCIQAKSLLFITSPEPKA